MASDNASKSASGSVERGDAPPRAAQVPAREPARPGVSAYRPPSPASFVALAAFALCYTLMFLLPGPAVLRLANPLGSLMAGEGPHYIEVGLTALVLIPVEIVLFVIFLATQGSDLASFAARQPRPVDTWRAPTPEWRRSEESRRYHLAETVEAIARQRFAFPNAENPDLRTYVNLPEPKLAIEEPGTRERVFPDIVAVAGRGNVPVAIAQVESRETVTPEQAKYVWARLQDRSRELYIYVPAGLLAQARDYAKLAGLKRVQFRTWRWSPGGMVVREV